jgi:hypothetical protein
MMRVFPKPVFFGVTLPTTFGSAVLGKDFAVGPALLVTRLIPDALNALAVEKPNNAEKKEREQGQDSLLALDSSRCARLAGLRHEWKF